MKNINLNGEEIKILLDSLSLNEVNHALKIDDLTGRKKSSTLNRLKKEKELIKLLWLRIKI